MNSLYENLRQNLKETPGVEVLSVRDSSTPYHVDDIVRVLQSIPNVKLVQVDKYSGTMVIGKYKIGNTKVITVDLTKRALRRQAEDMDVMTFDDLLGREDTKALDYLKRILYANKFIPYQDKGNTLGYWRKTDEPSQANGELNLVLIVQETIRDKVARVAKDVTRNVAKKAGDTVARKRALYFK